MRTIDDMVRQEVICCVSSLVSSLAQGAHGILSQVKCHDMSQLSELCDQALELALPVPDYEEAAIQENWRQYTDKFGVACWRRDYADGSPSDTWAGDAQSLCESESMEPYDWEVFEHWAVSEWFAERLAEAGERVDRDFANLCVWARTTTGQGIASDGVVKRIYAATHMAEA